MTMDLLHRIAATLKGDGWEHAWGTLVIFVACVLSAFAYGVVFGLVRW